MSDNDLKGLSAFVCIVVTCFALTLATNLVRAMNGISDSLARIATALEQEPRP